jgi:orotate phosphoribosyltransferase
MEPTIQQSKEAFITLCLNSGVLEFGDFYLKSGRRSPYFFNMGMISDGFAMRQLANFYADQYIADRIEPKQLFGPAYKGIPLATATAIALADKGINTTLTFNRKEVKQHGEGGQFIGAKLKGNTLVIDDVITAGTAFREAQQYINSQGSTATHLLIALNRCEPGIHGKSTIENIEAEGVSVSTIITVYDIIAFLQTHQKTRDAQRLQAYLAGL